MPGWQGEGGARPPPVGLKKHSGNSVIVIGPIGLCMLLLFLLSILFDRICSKRTLATALLFGALNIYLLRRPSGWGLLVSEELADGLRRGVGAVSRAVAQHLPTKGQLVEELAEFGAQCGIAGALVASLLALWAASALAIRIVENAVHLVHLVVRHAFWEPALFLVSLIAGLVRTVLALCEFAASVLREAFRYALRIPAETFACVLGRAARCLGMMANTTGATLANVATEYGLRSAIVVAAAAAIVKGAEALIAFVPSGLPLQAVLAAALAFAIYRALRRHFVHVAVEAARNEAAAHRRRSKRAETFPSATPNGWYALAMSEDVKPGAPPLRIEALGRTLALYRGSDTNKVFCLDAHCPHLGADMSSAGGGRVRGDCLECPFHKWTFDGTTGVCKSTPDGGKVPKIKSAEAHAYVVRDHYGYVAVWIADTDAPTWELPRIDAIDAGFATRRGAKRLRDVDMHIQDWAENGVDSAHFEVIHSDMKVPWLGAQSSIPGLKVQHNGKFELPKGEDDWYRAVFTNVATLVWRGSPLPWTAAKATVEFLGPGGINHMTFDLPKLGKVYLLEAHTPTEELKLETRFRWFADASVPSVVAWYVIGSWYSQWEADVDIWGNKVYRSMPPLRANDGPVQALRRWYRKFYPAENEATPSNAAEGRCFNDEELAKFVASACKEELALMRRGKRSSPRSSEGKKARALQDAVPQERVGCSADNGW